VFLTPIPTANSRGVSRESWPGVTLKSADAVLSCPSRRSVDRTQEFHDHRRETRLQRHWRVDTHADGHVAAALDSIGGLLGTQSFPITRRLRQVALLAAGFGALRLVGIEGTGSYGAGLARHMAGAGAGRRD